MIRSDRLPDFVFVQPDGQEQRLALTARIGRLHAIAGAVRDALSPTPEGVVVGLMYPSGPELVLAWLGCVLAGAQPLVMQYPTRKQTRQYWENSVVNTIGVTGLKLVLCDAFSAGMGLGRLVPVLEQSALDAQPDLPPTPFQIIWFDIIQLSSGTTGHRKAMRLDAAALLRHVTDFNQVLHLGATDRIVSWLPLYHDMGYVACFIMPLMLSIEVVMMDPITWVQTPALLYDAIEKHAGTICYMPNFGFEVMAREAPRALPTMRHWISCSEPVSPATARKFLASIAAPEAQFAACYAMAENVFAVSLARGITTREIDGVEVISCGTPIPGVAVKIVDGQIWARSPSSISAYLEGGDIRDTAGYYPTGDLGALHDGALYVTGRSRDLLIQAGRKFMLSDIDLMLNRLFPDIRGRAAAIARDDARLGTQVAVVLIEAADFFERNDQEAIALALRDAMNLDQIEVEFVPPRFLTKTSSGKINRKLSAAHWAAVQAHRGVRSGASDPVDELRAAFPRVDRDQPVSEVLDSLSLTVLRIILNGADLPYDGTQTLEQIEALLASGVRPDDGNVKTGLRIVSLADRRTISKLTEKHLDALAAGLGCAVSFEHVCLPPSPIQLSDLIFDDYFSTRLDPSVMGSVRQALDKLRDASLIIVDDAAELQMPPNQAYAALSHNLERDARTDLITVRWQSYPRQHHLLPTTFVAGRDLALADRATSLRQLAAYLGKPLFRVAGYQTLEPYTSDWEYHARAGTPDAPMALGIVRPDRLMIALADWIKALPVPPAQVALPRGVKLELNDLGHFCSHFANQPHIDILLHAYGSFCIAGQASSIPYIRQALQAAGKRYVCVPSYAPEILATVEEPYECLLICGAWGDFPITTPAGAIMFINNGAAGTINITDPRLTRLLFKRNAGYDPPSATDWFYPAKLHRGWDISVWAADRAAKAESKREAAKPRPTLVRNIRERPEPAPELAAARTARTLIDNAKEAREAGRLDEARRLAAQAVMAAPDNAVCYRLLASIAADQGDEAGLRAACDAACARLPAETEAFARLAAGALRKIRRDVKGGKAEAVS
jgi:acyl-CoA synthetase (AMP-forming)/AMP-acid ligase II